MLPRILSAINFFSKEVITRNLYFFEKIPMYSKNKRTFYKKKIHEKINWSYRSTLRNLVREYSFFKKSLKSLFGSMLYRVNYFSNKSRMFNLNMSIPQIEAFFLSNFSSKSLKVAFKSLKSSTLTTPLLCQIVFFVYLHILSSAFYQLRIVQELTTLLN